MEQSKMGSSSSTKARDRSVLGESKTSSDPLIWLEEVESDAALEYVEKQNNRLSELGKPRCYDRILKVLDSKEKIPHVKKIGYQYYNFWQDDKHERGIWQRCTMEEYKKKEPNWEVVLDLDELSKVESKKWVWKGSTLFDDGTPDTLDPDTCLVSLSRGGGDATEIREFDLRAKDFVKGDDAFFVPEAKSRATYKDADTLILCSDFGPGSMTNSGYPRIIKEWRRGTTLESAEVVFSGEKEDVNAAGQYIYDGNNVEYQISRRATGFYTSETYVHSVKGLEGVTIDNPPIKLPLPDDADLDYYCAQILVQLRSAWKGFPSGSLLSIPLRKVLAVQCEDAISVEDLRVLFEPSTTSFLEDYVKLKDYVIVVALDNVICKVKTLKFAQESCTWEEVHFEGEPDSGFCTLECWAIDSKRSNEYWMTSEGYTKPTTLSIASVGGAPAEALKSNPSFYDATGVKVEQHFAKSLDGTTIPYFMVYKDSLAQPKPTLLYGYGGFEISMVPRYQATTGLCWLEQGNVYVCANIRGGGEFGPDWHKAAVKANRNKCFEDFEAVARDLVERKVTTPKQLGTMGGSNGGLLMGNMLVRSPELFGAIVCMVPLLDMKRYHLLLAGASWQDEYGYPDTEDWDFLKNYSPYHLLDKAKSYPPILFTSSTRDDRVHPGHARKLHHKLHDLGFHKNTYMYENIEGGHGGASTNNQKAYMWALCYQFLETYICKP